ncbi:MAG: peptidoglycan-binding protein [Acidimicrobiia bacterium]
MGVKRTALIGVVVCAVGGAAAAGGIAEAAHGNQHPSPGNATGAVTTAPVVRTDLVSTIQVGGSIGYQHSYAITAPTGATALQVTQAEQAVSQAGQALSADQTAAADTAAADAQTTAAARTTVDADAATLRADTAQEARDCAGRGASTPACSQDSQRVSQDKSQDSQAEQALTTQQYGAVRDRDQNQAKIAADTLQVHDADTNLAAVGATAVNPGTTYTALPQTGQIITQDQPVYSVNGQAVPLLYGTVPDYRAFAVGMTDGADVDELTHDLITLGYGAGLTPSDAYSTATAAAVERWQAALGLPATGTVLVGQVVFEPGPIRVTSVSPTVGQAVTPGNVLDATNITPVVTVDLDVTQEYLVKPDDLVTVVLPDGTTEVGGRIATVGDVATCPNGNGNGAGNGNSNAGAGSADTSPCSAAGSGDSSTPTVAVTITLDSTPPGATLDQAPVDVNVTTQRADNVLAVPVNALLALQGGGYGVDVVSGATHQLVGITAGLYSDTMVQISGSGITAGEQVEVPAS